MTPRRDPTGGDHALERELLSRLRRPEIPDELRHESFLAGIYERAAADTATVAPLLEQCLKPSVAPEDASWVDVEEHPGLRQQVEEALPGAEAPGWLWSRVRHDMHEQRAQRLTVVRQRRMVRLAAAALVLCAAGIAVREGFQASFPASDGTPPTFKYVPTTSASMPDSWVLHR